MFDKRTKFTCVPVATKRTLRTEALWPCKVLRHEPSLRDHILTVLSPEVVAIVCSTGEKADDHTPRLCPLKVNTNTSDGSFQICRPAGTSITSDKRLKCVEALVLEKHSSEATITLAVRSWEVVHAKASLGESDKELMSFSCAWTVACDCMEASSLKLPFSSAVVSQSCK